MASRRVSRFVWLAAFLIAFITGVIATGWIALLSAYGWQSLYAAAAVGDMEGFRLLISMSAFVGGSVAALLVYWLKWSLGVRAGREPARGEQSVRGRRPQRREL